MPSLFSFPLNVGLLIAFLLLLWVVESEYGSRNLVRRMRSLTVSYWLLGIVVAWCVVGGLVPPQWATEGSLWKALGFQFFPSAWGFGILMFLLLAHLALIVIHRLRKQQWRRDLPFLMVHAGLWTALAGGMAGSTDRMEGRAIVGREAECRTMFLRDGSVVPLGYGLHLTDFSVEHNEKDGSVMQYAATISIDSTTTTVIAVNHPYAMRWDEDLYLNSYDQRHDASGERVEYAVLQIVREPWKHVTLAGIVMLGLGMVLLVLRLTTRPLSSI